MGKWELTSTYLPSSIIIAAAAGCPGPWSHRHACAVLLILFKVASSPGVACTALCTHIEARNGVSQSHPPGPQVVRVAGVAPRHTSPELPRPSHDVRRCTTTKRHNHHLDILSSCAPRR